MKQAPLSISVRAIADIVCQLCSVPRDHMMSYRRHHETTEARHIVCYIAAELTGRSYSEIGRIIARDHTTVMGAVRTIEARRLDDPDFAKRLHGIVDTCRAQAESFERSGRSIPPDIDAEAVARRILGTPRGAVRVSVVEIEAMAAAIITDRDLRNAVIRTLTAADPATARAALDDMIENVVTGPDTDEPAPKEATHV